MSKVERLRERLDEIEQDAGKGSLPPGMLPMQRGMYGKILQWWLLQCTEHDKHRPPETTNAELDKMRMESHDLGEIPVYTEVLRLRRWFMENDELSHLVPKLCYTNDRKQIEHDLEDEQARFRKESPKATA